MSNRDIRSESRMESRREFAFPDPTRPDPSLNPLLLNASIIMKAPTRASAPLGRRPARAQVAMMMIPFGVQFAVTSP